MTFTNLLKRRDTVALIVFILAFLVLIIWLLYLSTRIEHRYSAVNIPLVERGSIYDRRGRLLAEHVQTFTISIWLPDLRSYLQDESKEAYQSRLYHNAEMIGGLSFHPANELYRIINDTKINHFELLRRSQVEVKDAFVRLITEHNIKGIRIVSEYSRFYPNGSLASNLIGYVNNDNHGGEGIEYSFEQLLSPPTLGTHKRIVDGQSIELTIDANLQGIVERRVKQAFTNQKAESAVAIIMEAKTGAILSYVNLPTYNSNFYNNASYDLRLNRAVTDAFEPGSVFKIFTISALLDSGAIKDDDRFFCNGAYETVTTSGEKITIKCQGRHGWQTPDQILSNSCNTGTALASEKAGQRELYRYLKLYGFGTKTAVPFAGETAGLLADPSKWSARSKPTIAIGQEVATSAIQLVQATTVLSNSGQMIKPQFIKRIINADGTTAKEFTREIVRDVIKPQTADSLLKMLELGVTGGIARRMNVNGLNIAAKTGTSQTYDAITGSYSADNYIASSIAIFPSDAPQYIIYIAFHRPMGSSYFGASVVAPLIREIIMDIIPYDGIEIRGVQVYRVEGNINLGASKEETNSYLPDFSTMRREQAIALIRAEGINVKVYGDSKVEKIESQFPPPGSLMQVGTTIILYLSDN